MSEHFYSGEERRGQLEELAEALEALIPLVIDLPAYAPRAPVYERALGEARRLVCAGFTQEELSSLARSVPDLFYRFKEWSPPVEEQQDGSWLEPEWFAALEPRLQRVLEAARRLSEVGYY
jgi:hypothetical protein